MTKERGITDKVRDSISKFKMLLPGEKVIVAVSGGPDSVCLLEILAELSNSLDIGLVIAHYNHCLRNGEDDIETGLVKKLAERHGCPFDSEKAAGLDPEMPSLEEMARKSRYAFLERIRIKHNAHKIALGHNLNDQAETFIIRLLRGSSMPGLSGIPPLRDGIIIRPLLQIKREEILDYLNFRQIEYATDSSNTDKKFLRNRIRLELLPEMLEYQPKLIEIIGRLSDQLREENEFLDMEVLKWVEDEVKEDKKKNVSFSIPSFNRMPPVFGRRVIRIIVAKYIKNLHGIDAKHINAVTELVQNEKSNVSISLPKGLTVKKEYERLLFTMKKDCSEQYRYVIKKPGTFHIKESGQKIIIERIDRRPVEFKSHDPNTAFLDEEMMPFPLTVRNFIAGDRFIPLGMKGYKKVKDFFIDLKIPLKDRKSVPILLKDDKIIWIGGYRIDDRFKVTSETKKLLKVTLM